MSPVNLEDYIPVNERLTAFYARHPEGSIQSELVELSDKRVVMRAYAYRTPDDTRPGIGYSSMNIPGSTSFTRGSEVENTETSAWGRAIAALGFEVKRGIATAEEVASKSSDKPKRGSLAEGELAMATREKPAEPDTNEPTSLGPYSATGLAGINPSPAARMDGNLRAEKEHGHMLGFVLATSAEGRIPQVVAVGDLAVDISDAIEGKGSYFDQRKVTVEGELFDVWFTPKGTTVKRKFQRLVLSRLETDDFALPSPRVVEGQEELALGVAE